MRHDYFTTSVYRGTFRFDDNTFNKYKEWLEFEKTLDPNGVVGSTTHQGYQIGLPNKLPDWFNPFYQEIKKVQQELEKDIIKSSWFVEYETGGFQDPHYHPSDKVNALSVIFNIRGQGELVLYDPRSFAVSQGAELGITEVLNDCEWIAIPTWLLHSSRPSKNPRSIFVSDFL